MTANSFFIMFPIAFDIGDLFGALVPIIIIIMSLMGRRGTQQQEEEPFETPQSLPPRQSQIPPARNLSEGTMPETDLADEMKRFLESVRRSGDQPQPLPIPYHSPVAPPAPVRRKQPPPKLSGPVKPQVSSSVKTVPVHEIMGGSLQAGIHEEVERSMHALGEDVKASISEPNTVRIEGNTEYVSGGSLPYRMDLSFLRTPSNLKQAVILSEILGKPRALNPQ